MLGNADRDSGHGKDRPAYHNSGGQENIYTADNSSSEGFLDLYERDKAFLPRGPPSRVGPHFHEATFEIHTPNDRPSSISCRSLGPYESVPQRGAESTAIGTGCRAVPGMQAQETQEIAQRYDTTYFPPSSGVYRLK